MRLHGAAAEVVTARLMCAVAGELGAAGKHLKEAAEEDVHQAGREACDDVDEHQVRHAGSGRAAPSTGLPVGPPAVAVHSPSLICKLTCCLRVALDARRP